LAVAGGDGVIAAAVSGYTGRSGQPDEASVAPPALHPARYQNMAPDWEWQQSANGLPAVKLKAKQMTQSADGSKAQLEQIELDLYAKTASITIASAVPGPR